MEKLARYIQKKDVWVILGILGLSVYSVISAFRISFDDDITAFFPEGSEEVALFKDVGKKFGGLDIALVGLETKDVFTLKNLRLVRAVSRRLQDVDGVGSVTSLTEMRDFEEKTFDGESGALIQNLVGELPDDMSKEDLAALRAKVMSRPHLVGSVVSAKGDAVLLVVKLETGAGWWKTAAAIKRAVGEVAGYRGDVRAYFGGAPCISEYITSGTQRDVRRLSPWVALTVVVVIFASFRSMAAAFLSLFVLAIGLVVTIGLMPVIGVKMDLVSTSLPMILASIASAYGIHLIARFFLVLGSRPGTTRQEAVTAMLKEVGVPVTMAAATTFVGFSSFLVMDIKPLRSFGFIMAVGVAFCFVLTVLFVVAALNRLRIGTPGGKESRDMIGGPIARIAAACARRPKTAAAVAAVLLGGSIVSMTRISSDTSAASYFPEGSEPILADQFMIDRFGGSLFLQLYVQGDMKSPLVLRQLQHMEDDIRRMEGVTGVQSIAQVIGLASSALTGKEIIPPERDQVVPLVYLAEDDPAVGLLVDKEWKSALVQVRIKGFDTKSTRVVTEQLAAYIAKRVPGQLAEVALDRVKDERVRRALEEEAMALAADRIGDDLLALAGVEAAPERIKEQVRAVVAQCARACAPEYRASLGEALRRDLVEDELIYLDPAQSFDDLVGKVCDASVAGSLTEQSLYEQLLAAASPEERASEEEAAKGKAAGGDESITGFRKVVRIVLQSVTDAKERWAAGKVAAALAGGKLEAMQGSPAQRKLLQRVAQHLDFLSTGRVMTAGGKELDPTAVAGRAGMRVALTGYPILNQRMTESVMWNQYKSTIVAIVILFVLLAILFKSLLVGAISILPALLTLLMVYGFLGVTGIPMDMGVSMVSVIAMGASVDYPIHFFWKYREVCHEGFDRAIRETMTTTGKSIALNAIEVMVGFGILLFAVVTPVRKAGGLISATLFVSAAATLFVMPAFVKLAEKKVHEKLKSR